MMVGLHLLKHRLNLSDEAVVAQLHENMYWQAFCGVEWPIVTDEAGKIIPTILVEASTLTKFRERIGPEGVAQIESVLQDQLIAEKVISPHTAIFDTTAQEKHIAYPLDTQLLHRGRGHLIQLIRKAQKMGIRVSKGLRSFVRKSRQVLITVHKLGGDRQERIERGTRQLISYARHVIKRVPGVLRALRERIGKERRPKNREQMKHLYERLGEMRARVRQVITQAQARWQGIHLPGKLYSLHEPHVVCIRKGKRSKPNEYGCKVALSIDRNGYVVTHQEIAGNPSDVKLLPPALVAWQKIVGCLPQELVGNRGVTPKRGAKLLLLRKIPRVALPARGKRPCPQQAQPWFERLVKTCEETNPYRADHQPPQE